MKNLDTAARAFMEAVHAKRDAEESQFYGDPAIEKAYAGLTKVIKQGMSEDVEWGWEVLDHCMGHGEAIRREQPELEQAVVKFTKELEWLLAHVSKIEWIACVPLERIFRKFPDFTDFGTFAILNPAGTSAKPENELLDSFRLLLSDRCGVTFAAPRDPYNNESYLRLGEHYLRKSGHYIPGRPTLVIKLGKGEERANQRQLQSKLQEILPLIQLCQVAMGLDQSFLNRTTGPHSTLPDGKWMDDGLIAVPAVAVALDKSNGNCGWWGTGINLYENQVGEGYDPKKFQQVWRTFAQPLLELRELSGPNKFRFAVDNAIRLVSRCRHEEFGDATVSAVIATETILNPFNPTGDIKERFAAAYVGAHGINHGRAANQIFAQQGAVQLSLRRRSSITVFQR